MAQYKQIKQLSDGGGTPTHLLEDTNDPNKKIILKIANDTHFKRFLANAYSIFQKNPDLSGENIQKIIEISYQDSENGLEHIFAYLNYLSGEPSQVLAQQLFQNNALNSQEKIQIINNFFESLCQLVCTLHDKNLVHCDIKPDNTLFEKQQGTDGKQKIQAKLIDPTLLIEAGQSHYPDNKYTFCGSKIYMPPEMIFANKAIGWPHSNIIQPKSDIYALAVTYYELIELAILPEKKHIFPSRSKPIYPYPDFTDPIIEFKLAMLRKTDNNNLYNIIKSNLHNFRTPKATAQIIALAIQKTLQSNPSLRPQTVADLMTDLNL